MHAVLLAETSQGVLHVIRVQRLKISASLQQSIRMLVLYFRMSCQIGQVCFGCELLFALLQNTKVLHRIIP